MIHDSGLKAAADLVRSIATQAMTRFPEGYAVRTFDSEFFPSYIFYRDGLLIGAVRQCGEVAGVSANVENLSDPLGMFLDELLLANDVPIDSKGENGASYEKGDMYYGRHARVEMPVQLRIPQIEIHNPNVPLTKNIDLSLLRYF